MGYLVVNDDCGHYEIVAVDEASIQIVDTFDEAKKLVTQLLEGDIILAKDEMKRFDSLEITQAKVIK